MTIQTKEVMNEKMTASSVLGTSTEGTSAVARLAIYNVIENQISALIFNSTDEMHKKEIESALNHDIRLYVDNFLSQKLDEFKYSVLTKFRNMEFTTKVRRIEYVDHQIKDVHVDLKIDQKE